jgi:hypothetical protein
MNQEFYYGDDRQKYLYKAILDFLENIPKTMTYDKYLKTPNK